ncbi:MAG TPA: hypothetical protein VHW09_25720 [Bryobacteraceae bacterium]|jgi:hypothetical protein|nr:hypothetical protein [Bryobacteraceae bacterium]
MMLVKNANGSKQPAVILALNGAVLRVALKDGDDVEEYRLVGQTWVSTQCEPVTFEFPLGIFEAIGMMPPNSGVCQ